jgi:WD40 repeat protein/serine/threonine protein kinase
MWPEESLQRLATRLLEDQRARWARGEPIPVEAYLLQHPELQGDDEAVVDLIYQEILLQKGKGLAPAPDAWLARFPQYEAELKDQLELDELLGSPSLGDSPTRTAPAWPRLPGYEVLGELGGGGMGVVYLGYDPRLKRQVAIKVIRGGRLATKEERARFRTEAEAIARLQHPHIAQIFEVGEHRDGPYLVLEYVAGGSLDRWLSGKPQPARAAAGLVETLARAIQHAHERGIVHRDLKPANILLQSKSTTDSTDSTDKNKSSNFSSVSSVLSVVDFLPRITDFGLAKLREGGAGVTSSGAVLGTANYMPPEQAQGKEGAIGPAADVYTLGAILYEMLTGRPPFQGESPVETVLQVLTADPVPPRRLQPRVPRDLETICLKCLDKKAGRRYPSAHALADDLARFREGQPIQARPVRPWERALKWARRRPALAALTAVTVGVALLGFGLVAWQWRVAEAARQQETAQRKRFQRLSVDVVLARGLQSCRQGDVGQGLLELVRGLELAGDEAPDLQAVIRTNLADWAPAFCRLSNQFPLPSQVRRAALSPDGRIVATVCSDRKAYLTDLTTGKRLGQPLLHPAAIHAVAFSPDGKTLLTGTGDSGSGQGAVWLWEVSTGRLLVPPLEHRSPVWAVAWSPDGRQVLSGSGEAGSGRGEAQLWDVARGTALDTPLPHPRPVRAVAFSPDGRTILTGCADRAARLWDVASRQVLRVYKHGGYVDAVAFSPDGKTLLTAGRDSLARLWDAGAEGHVGNPMKHQGFVEAVAFSRDGKTVVTGSRDGTARLWDAATGQPIGDALSHPDRVTAVAFAPDGRTVLTGCLDRRIRVWQMPSGKSPEKVFAHTEQVWAVAFSPDGQHIATGCIYGPFRIWTLASGEPGVVSQRLGADVSSIALSPDGKTVLTGSRDGTARLWDSATGRPVREPFPHPDWVTSVAFRPDGKVVLTGCRDGAARLWDVASGLQLGPTLRHSRPVNAVAFSPRAPGVILTGSADRTARLWDIATGQCVAELRGHQGSVVAVAMSRDGRQIATGSDDGSARLWDGVTGQPVGEPLLHPGAVQAVALSPCGKILLTASRDGAGRLWDVASGRPLGMPLVHQGPVRAAAFSPDGRTALTAGEDMTARVWSVPTALTGSVEGIKRWCEVVTGMELDGSGVRRPLDAAAWRQRQFRLAGASIETGLSVRKAGP